MNDTPHDQQPPDPDPIQPPPFVPPSNSPDHHDFAPRQTPPGVDSSKFFVWLRSLEILRGNNRWVGGMCSGLGEKWGIDPVILRGLAVVLTLFFGFGLLAYGAAWALLPEPDGRINRLAALVVPAAAVSVPLKASCPRDRRACRCPCRRARRG